jgi:hypothetical protein
MFNKASYGQWQELYERAWGDPGSVAALACPNCDWGCLSLVFVMQGDSGDRGQGVFWCGNCLNGIVMYSPIPEQGVRVTRDEANIPGFAIVPPGYNPA